MNCAPLLIALSGVYSPIQEPPNVAPSPASSLTGTFRTHAAFPSRFLGRSRDLLVYLPPGYERDQSRRYPVMYLHDGQNVFDGATSFIPNQEWRADETAQALIEAGLVEPLILVAIPNAGAERGNEYLPTRAKVGNEEAGGQADLYGRMIVEEIKPMIDRTYRTKRDAKNTGLCGSSFGGIVTLHLGLRYPNVFGKLAVVSPSVWWDDKVMLKQVRALPRKLPLRVWVDIGTGEARDAFPYAVLLRDALVKKGWKEGRDLAFYVDKGAKHNEMAWAGRFDAILLFLFPRQS